MRERFLDQTTLLYSMYKNDEADKPKFVLSCQMVEDELTKKGERFRSPKKLDRITNTIRNIK